MNEAEIGAGALFNFDINNIMGEENMLWTIMGVLAVLWLLGVVTSYTMGRLIHILLVIAGIGFLLTLFRSTDSIAKFWADDL